MGRGPFPSSVDFKCDFRWCCESTKKTLAQCIFSVGHLGGPKGSKSIGNQLLAYIGIIPEINSLDRVQLATKLEHCVGSLPLIPAKGNINELSKGFVQQYSYIATKMHACKQNDLILGEGFRQNALTLSLVGLCGANLFQV